MSGKHSSSCTTTPHRFFGPARPSRLELMGIRFFVTEDPDLGGGGGAGGGAGGGGGGDDKPITFSSQADLDRIIADRVARAKPKDYDALKAKADKFDQLEQSQLTDAEKVAEKLTTLEGRATTAESALEPLKAQLLRYEVAAEKKLDLIHAPRLQGTTKEDIEKDADTFIASLGGTNAGGSGNKRDPGQGGRDEQKAGDKGKSEAERRFGDKAKQ